MLRLELLFVVLMDLILSSLAYITYVSSML